MRRRGEHCAFRGAFPAALARLPRLRLLHLEAPYSALNAATIALPDCASAWGSQVGWVRCSAWEGVLDWSRQAPRPAVPGCARLARGVRAVAAPAARSCSPCLAAHLPCLPLVSAFPVPETAACSWRSCTLQQLTCAYLIWLATPPSQPACLQLEELHLINMGIEALPPALGGLPRLRALCLARNRLGQHPGAVPWALSQVRLP